MKSTSVLKIIAFALALLAIVLTLMALQPGETAEEEIDSFSDKYHIAIPPIPETVTFAGEEVPLDDWNALERLERELLVNTYWQSNTMLMLKRSGRYFDEIETILASEGIPEDFKYLAMAESGLTQAVSPAGAKGIWQFISSTAQAYGLKVDSEVDERYDLEKATRATCKYLKKAKAETGSWTLAAAAFNRGLSGIKRDVRNQQVSTYHDLYLNSETSRYVFRIIALKLLHENPTNYGFNISKKDYYKPIPVYVAQIDTTIADLALFAQEHGTTYRNIKLINPWIRDDHLTVKSGQVHKIKIPEVLASAADE